ncbi:hypothetical protein M422DRAFT_237579 [Sphaerobolus stellatus SS14]|uniref:Cerato-platanin n=1 Tax=Sphaerobolus stellatus (strain SS14) TaxID=990650 RepID=A0A0C9T558_SPHS4|nr:hypothetical protein M422DRAFT_237579 [Sphaerobolus stellatus SS14]
MKFSIAAVTAILAFVGSSVADIETVSFDTVYDNGDNSLDIVSCSTGQFGLITKGFTTFGSLPNFPYIGGAAVIPGFNSPNCGTCWALTYNGVTINVLAIDHAGAGFNIAEEALNTLTNGQAVQLGRINASVQQVANSVCGL